MFKKKEVSVYGSLKDQIGSHWGETVSVRNLCLIEITYLNEINNVNWKINFSSKTIQVSSMIC